MMPIWVAVKKQCRQTDISSLVTTVSSCVRMATLTDLLAQHEGKMLEFKRDVPSPENIIRTVVAFSDGAGGTIIVGVDDRTRSVHGIPDPTTTEELLANLISDRIEPRLVSELQIVPWRKTCVIALRVYPSSSRPHFVKAAGPEQGAYVRVGVW